MLEEEVEKYLNDPSLANALKKVIEADHQIDGVTEELVEKLHHYQNRYKEICSRENQLELDL